MGSCISSSSKEQQHQYQQPQDSSDMKFGLPFVSKTNNHLIIPSPVKQKSLSIPVTEMDHFNDDLLDTLPGPSRANVIWDNRYHVSEDVWDGSGREELDCICGNRAMRDWKLRRPQRELLHMMGFGIFTNPHVVLGNDARLISAMIERWRPETNTFFMRQGEMTVTLEDVGYILGLPVVGEAVTCGLIANRKEFFVRNWFEPLTDEEVDDALFRNHIKLTWLFERYGRQKPEKHNAEATIVHAQAYLADDALFRNHIKLT